MSLKSMTRKNARRLLGISLFLFSLRCIAQSSASSEHEIESHSRRAQTFLRENRPDLAIPEFRAIVALNHNNVNALGNLGVLLFFQGQYADALPPLRAALKLRPTLWKIQALLGISEKRTGDIETARRDLEKSFPRVPEEKIQIETGMELVELYSASRELDKAASIVMVLRELKPTDETILYTAYRVYSDLTDESLLSLSVVAPNSARMHQGMAHELAKRGNITAAFENYRAALKIDPQLPGLHFELAELLRTSTGQENHAEAESQYKAALQVNPLDEQAECRLGDIAVQRNDLEEAGERFTKALKLQPNDPQASIGLAKVSMAEGQLEQAASLLEHALQLEPTSAVVHFRLGTVYRQLGRTDDARHEIEQYQKYKKMREKLEVIYHEIGTQTAQEEQEGPKK